ncbi:MAG TPA: hypothetical protein VFK30_06195, partial [Anaerolineae bacterium]|nr:hypothetical protein [Anaerolineae bacterium]
MLYGAIASSKVRPLIEEGALFSGAGNLTILANSLLMPTASFGGLGNLSVSGFTTNPIQQGSVDFIAAGNLAVSTRIISQGSANFAGAGNVRAFNTTVAFSV